MQINKKTVFWALLAALTLAAIIMIPAHDPGEGSVTVAREDTVIFDLDRQIKNPRNFNWFTPGVKRAHGAHQSMWEPLFILSYETGDLQPWLGLSFTPNQNMDQWVLKLRSGVEWSDGEVFDADDVVFTVNMVLDSSDISAAEAVLLKGQVASVRKIDPLTVEFVLKKPNPSFHIENFGVRNFSSFLIMPEHIWRGENVGSFDFYPPIGTGAYKFHSATSQRAIWDRNDDWWGAKAGFKPLPQPQRLIWLESGGQENRAQLLVRNDMDAGQDLALGIFVAIKKRNPDVISWHDGFPYSWTDPCPRQLEINTTVKPWDDPELRNAISYLIDRQQIVDIVYEGSTVVSNTMFVQYGAMQGFIDAIKQAGYTVPKNADVARGQAMLEARGYQQNEAGYYQKDGQVLGVKIKANTASAETTSTVDLIVEQLQRAGVDARTEPVENAVFWGEIVPLGSYEMSYSWLSCGSVNEPWSSMRRYTNENWTPIGERAPGFNNTGRWNTEATTAYTKIVDEIGRRALNDSQVPNLVAEAYQYLDAEKPFIPLVQASKLLSFNSTYWQGWPQADNFYSHPMFWWNSTHQIIHSLRKAGDNNPQESSQ